MKRSRAKGMANFEAIPLTTPRNHDVRPRSAAGGYALSPGELEAIHGGTLKIVSHPFPPFRRLSPPCHAFLTFWGIPPTFPVGSAVGLLW